MTNKPVNKFHRVKLLSLASVFGLLLFSMSSSYAYNHLMILFKNTSDVNVKFFPVECRYVNERADCGSSGQQELDPVTQQKNFSYLRLSVTDGNHSFYMRYDVYAAGTKVGSLILNENDDGSDCPIKSSYSPVKPASGQGVMYAVKNAYCTGSDNPYPPYVQTTTIEFYNCSSQNTCPPSP